MVLYTSLAYIGFFRFYGGDKQSQISQQSEILRFMFLKTYNNEIYSLQFHLFQIQTWHLETDKQEASRGRFFSYHDRYDQSMGFFYKTFLPPFSF